MTAAMERPKVIVVLPAYNAEKTLRQTVSDIPRDAINEIILVDDCSRDKTAHLAKEMGLTVFAHAKNDGYGANQKTCYRTALEHGADIVVMLHPDYQYDPKLIKHFVAFISEGYFDVMLGSRIRTRSEALLGGMPAYKYYANRFLSVIENIVTGQKLSEWHTGMRAYRREVLEGIDFMANSNDFVFDTQVLFQVVEKGFRIGEISVPVRYFPEASSIGFARGMRYGLSTLSVALRYLFRRKRRDVYKIHRR
ncbi:MAG: glycosyl transferase family 2 [Candidatus Omnitrophica bacterium CG1_02_49_10]|nr:MAG: glycosyl transferase family 2 [Candidatus Omnitrophica bacterium CG1_02_49_10]